MNWLARHRRVAITLAVFHVVVSIFVHAAVQDLARWIQDRLTATRMNSLVTVLGLAFLAVSAIVALVKLRRAPNRLTRAAYCVATVGLVAVTYRTMLMINTESIHFVQYALLAVIVFSIKPRFGETVLIVTLLGAFDEAHQYWVLNRDTPQYFDFNDIILNMEGGALGVMALVVLIRSESPTGTVPPYSLATFARSPAALATAAVVVVALLLGLLGQIALYPESEAWIVLRSIGPPPEEFFRVSFWGKVCHVLMPWEGVAVIAMIAAFYVSLDFRITLELAPRPHGDEDP